MPSDWTPTAPTVAGEYEVRLGDGLAVPVTVRRDGAFWVQRSSKHARWEALWGFAQFEWRGPLPAGRGE